MITAAEEELPKVAEPEIDRCIQRRLHEKSFSAAACVASVRDVIFHRQVYGNPVMPPPLCRIEHDALFDLASLSKPLGAGLAALYMAGKGRLNLHSHLGQIVPELRGGQLNNITLDMLLDHTAGFAATAPLWEPIEKADIRRHPKDRVLGTRRAVPDLKKLLAKHPLASIPGTETLYSDLGFVALGWAIENVVGKPLDVFLEQEIYRPLGVHEDLFFVRHDDPDVMKRLKLRTVVATEQCPWRAELLRGKVHDPLAWSMGGVAGHAGLFGTADAVWRLLRALLLTHQGEEGTGMFHPATVQRFWTRSRRLKDTTRTLAWDTPSARDSTAGSRFSRTSVGHLGFTGTSIWIDLKTQIVGVVLTNAVHPNDEGKREMLKKFRPRIYDRIASCGDAALSSGPAKKA